MTSRKRGASKRVNRGAGVVAELQSALADYEKLFRLQESQIEQIKRETAEQVAHLVKQVEIRDLLLAAGVASVYDSIDENGEVTQRPFSDLIVMGDDLPTH